MSELPCTTIIYPLWYLVGTRCNLHLCAWKSSLRRGNLELLQNNYDRQTSLLDIFEAVPKKINSLHLHTYIYTYTKNICRGRSLYLGPIEVIFSEIWGGAAKWWYQSYFRRGKKDNCLFTLKKIRYERREGIFSRKQEPSRGQCSQSDLFCLFILLMLRHSLQPIAAALSYGYASQYEEKRGHISAGSVACRMNVYIYTCMYIWVYVRKYCDQDRAAIFFEIWNREKWTRPNPFIRYKIKPMFKEVHVFSWPRPFSSRKGRSIEKGSKENIWPCLHTWRGWVERGPSVYLMYLMYIEVQNLHTGCELDHWHAAKHSQAAHKERETNRIDVDIWNRNISVIARANLRKRIPLYLTACVHRRSKKHG